MSQKPLQHFVLGVLVFFPLTFFLWYSSAAFHLAPITLLTSKLLHWFVPDALMWLKLDGHTLVLASNFGHDASGAVLSPPPGDDVLGFNTNPLIYSYSLPLVVALMLATPGKDKWHNLLWGMLLVLPSEVFSMLFSVLKTLTFDVGAAFQAQQGISAAGADMIALGYQVGVLLLPMIMPLIIWVALNRSFIMQLAPQLERVFSR